MNAEKKKSIKYYLLSSIGCFVGFFLLISLFGQWLSNFGIGHKSIVNLGVILIIVGIFSVIRLLIILFSKEK